MKNKIDIYMNDYQYRIYDLMNGDTTKLVVFYNIIGNKFYYDFKNKRITSIWLGKELIYRHDIFNHKISDGFKNLINDINRLNFIDPYVIDRIMQSAIEDIK